MEAFKSWYTGWYTKAGGMIGSMTKIQESIYWNLLKRIFLNPIAIALELSIRDLSFFLERTSEKLMFDHLTQISRTKKLSDEQRRFQIIKTVLQEYASVIVGKPWLSESVLGYTLFSHLSDPKISKDLNKKWQLSAHSKSWVVPSMVPPPIVSPPPTIVSHLGSQIP